ncbi:PX domain-containing protein EREL1 [Linum perenne]
MAVASFLELEVAARSSFQDSNQESSEAALAGDATTSSSQIPMNSSSSGLTTTSSVASDYGSDTAYEASELGTPRLGKDENSEIGVEDLSLDEDLTNPIEKLAKYGMSNIDEGLFMGQTILEQLEGIPRRKSHTRHANSLTRNSMYNGDASKVLSLSGNGVELFSEPEHGMSLGHARKLSSESVGSDGSSLRGIENIGVSNSMAFVSPDRPRGSEVSSSTEVLSKVEAQFSGSTQIVLPLDQRHKMTRVLSTMQRRLVTAKTDMEDLISRLNQERATKDYLTRKVKDLEVELETSKQKNKENLQQAILIERERLTQMQWDMEELRRKVLESELKLKSKEDEKSNINSDDGPSNQEKIMAQQELDITKKKLEDLTRKYEALEAKSKAELKFLAKEFKALQSSQTELKEERDRTMKEKAKIEKHLEQEKRIREHEKDQQKRLLHDCRTLWSQLQECNLSLSSEDDDEFVLNSSLEDALDLLETFDDRISLILAEAQLLATEDDRNPIPDGKANSEELRMLLADIVADNAKLRKQVNSATRRALRKRTIARGNGESSSDKP